MSRPILLCTVGTSLVYPNLSGLRRTLAEDGGKPDNKKTIAPTLAAAADRLADAFDAKNWDAVAAALAEFPGDARLCGAEVNSIASLIKHGYAPDGAGIFFFHSDTDDGRQIADVLVRLFRQRGHDPVEVVAVPDLQDKDAKRFRTKGLRNLAKLLCSKVRDYTQAACAINATGGYKAQIAVAVLLGQALGIPVYYMHERFSEIIAFPPMPVALDFEVWMRFSGWLTAMEKNFVPRAAVEEDGWDERYEGLVEADRDEQGCELLSLSATGQIFHETFRHRFRTDCDRVLPPTAEPGRKRPAVLHDHAVINLLRGELMRYLGRVTDEVQQVVQCVTSYSNPDLPEYTRFRERGGEVEGVYSDGTRTVKFKVETTAITAGQRAAVVAALNEWLSCQG
ncbi:MAG: putative CRISPR-associated protein [Gemmataceae bacterium]